MINCDSLEAWFIVGSQHLYGDETLQQVADHAAKIVEGLNQNGGLPVRIVLKPVVTTAEQITNCLTEANASANCVGLIVWMHTFSPAKMWINGLKHLHKPLAHLHTQFNRDIPWADIDMDFMNLNQSAHGGREFGHVCRRLGMRRKVVVGHWDAQATQQRLDAYLRAAVAWHDCQHLRIARFGDNMRQVAVTEGDKVEAQRVFGYTVDGYGIGDLADVVASILDAEVDTLCQRYDEGYDMAAPLLPTGDRRVSLRDAARIELGLRKFLEDGGYDAFTDTFEDLHGLKQLPGIAAQRLMADGYGFGAEGDWKHAALVRSMKVMAHGLAGGVSFMEDYTYHLNPQHPQVLGAHMLEICPTIADGKPRCEIHPLSIGGKEDPVRLVFDAQTGPAINASVIDVGPTFELLVNEVNAIEPQQDLPKLPVARAIWEPLPDFETGVRAWIEAGGAHHTGYSLSLTREHMEDFARMAGIRLTLIGRDGVNHRDSGETV